MRYTRLARVYLIAQLLVTFLATVAHAGAILLAPSHILGFVDGSVAAARQVFFYDETTPTPFSYCTSWDGFSACTFEAHSGDTILVYVRATDGSWAFPVEVVIPPRFWCGVAQRLPKRDRKAWCS